MNTLNRLVEANTLMPRANSTLALPSTLNSLARLALSIAMFFGNQTHCAMAAMTPMTDTAQNVERQPAYCPSAVPRGTPSTLARVRPVNIMAIAWARLFGATSPAATTEPMPKNAPWHSAVTTRAAISVA
ncbi:hypothetical protein D3C85_1492370 [compost metagenome]